MKTPNWPIACIVGNSPASSGYLKYSAVGLGFARVKGPLAVVAPLCPERSCAANREVGWPLDINPDVSGPNEVLRWPSEDVSALFHCLTSSTAWSKSADALATGASLRLQPTIQLCFRSFFAPTRRLGSFWKHCIRKSRAAWSKGQFSALGAECVVSVR